MFLVKKNPNLFRYPAFYVFVLICAAYVGLSALLWKADVMNNPVYLQTVRILAGISGSLLFLITVIEFIAPLINPQASWRTAFIAIGVFFCLIFSEDGVLLFDLKASLPIGHWFYTLWRFMQVFSLIFASVGLFLFVTRVHHYPYDRRIAWVSFGIFVACLACFVPLDVLGMGSAVIVPWFLVVIVWFVAAWSYLRRKGTWDHSLFFAMFIVISAGMMVFLCALFHDLRGFFLSLGISSVISLAIAVMFLSIYLGFIVKTGKAVIEKQEFEKKATEMQSNILRNQISSHFLFNTLSVIKAYYRIDVGQGDRAVDLLSRFFRSYTEAGNTYLVPLKKELDLIQSYLELQNLKGGSPFTLLFNIDTYDFEVPYFSLQPLLENAIQHSGANEKANGYIEIDSYQEGESYIIVFKDNGRGFDTSAPRKEESVGLKNVADRFALWLHATMDVQSEVGKGTTITIRIPKNMGETK